MEKDFYWLFEGLLIFIGLCGFALGLVLITNYELIFDLSITNPLFMVFMLWCSIGEMYIIHKMLRIILKKEESVKK